MSLVPGSADFDKADGSSARDGSIRFTIDLDTCGLRDADARARSAFGVKRNATERSGPLSVLDAAMPALVALRLRRDDIADFAQPQRLTFWTAGGPAAWLCRVRIDRKPGSRLARITAMVQDDETRSTVRSATEPHEASTVSLASLGHELRTPLAAIVSLAEVMAQERFGELGNARYLDYSRSIADTARHAMHVAESMLGPVCKATSVPEQVFTEVDVDDIVREIARSAGPMAAEVGRAITIELHAGMPKVIADRVSIRRIVFNLVKNSLEHARGATKLVVRTGAAADSGAWIEVEDDGPGIPLHVAEYVGSANPSGAAQAMLAANARSGLGLTLTLGLAQANAARIEVLSVIPKGARVRLNFSTSRCIPV